jgi:hypothetical protein
MCGGRAIAERIDWPCQIARRYLIATLATENVSRF